MMALDVILYLLLSVIFTPGPFVTKADSSVPNKNSPNKIPSINNHGVKISLYNRKVLGLEHETSLLNGRLKFRAFSKELPTKVIIHGWLGHDDNFLIEVMKEDVLPIEDINMIVVDWSGGGSRNIIYNVARTKVHKVAKAVAEFLDNFSEKHDIKLEDVHIIGHSLGAQIAGITGYHVKNGKIGRITGLDPANPQFDFKDLKGRLSPESANFVDVIHTCGKFLGKQEPMGHADFFPNDGTWIQPGCGLDIAGVCSHLRSYYFYRDSFYDGKAFPAVKCDSWMDFEKKTTNCDFNNIVYMGADLTPSARGKYYLRTKNQSPFGFGNITNY